MEPQVDQQLQIVVETDQEEMTRMCSASTDIQEQICEYIMLESIRIWFISDKAFGLNFKNRAPQGWLMKPRVHYLCITYTTPTRRYKLGATQPGQLNEFSGFR